MKGPWRITLDTNPDDCNLNCVMCEEHSGFGAREKLFPRRMPLDMLEAVLQEAGEMGVKEIIPSTMGEPLLYKHFGVILDFCEKYGLSLNLTTNGTFPKLGAEGWAEKILPFCSDVKISINGISKAVQEDIMRGSNAERAWANIESFIQSRDRLAGNGKTKSTVTLQVTFLQSNVEELPAILEKSIELGVDRVKGHHVWIHFKETTELSMRRSPESIENWNKTAKRLQEISKSEISPNGKKIRLANIFPLNPHKPEELLKDGVCPFLGKELWISHEGKYSPCCAPDSLRKELGYFGAYPQINIADMWQSEEYASLRLNYRNHPLCQTCNMKVVYET